MIETGKEITLLLRCVDPKQSEKLRLGLLETMRDHSKPYEGFILLGYSSDNLFQQAEEDNSLLNEVADYLSRTHLGDEEAEDLIDKITNPSCGANIPDIPEEVLTRAKKMLNKLTE